MDALADEPNTEIGMELRMKVDARQRQLEGRQSVSAPVSNHAKFTPNKASKVRHLCLRVMTRQQHDIHSTTVGQILTSALTASVSALIQCDDGSFFNLHPHVWL